MRNKRRSLILLLAGGLGLSLGGCAVGLDLFSPTLATQLGLDVTALQPPPGTIIVAFNNGTRYPAQFYAFQARSATDLTSGSRNFSVEVQGGEVRNEVLECPVAVLGPGILGADFAYDGTGAVLVNTGTEVVSVDYPGQPLFSGDQYQCGDVIEVRLSATAVADTFLISVRVIPGR